MCYTAFTTWYFIMLSSNDGHGSVKAVIENQGVPLWCALPILDAKHLWPMNLEDFC